MFVGEFIVMLIFVAFPEMPIALEALVDGLMITTLATPVLQLFLFRPTVHQIEQREAAERELKILNDELEVRVGERTRELSSSNEQLRREVEDRRTAEIVLSKSGEFIHRVLEAVPCVIPWWRCGSAR